MEERQSAKEAYDAIVKLLQILKKEAGPKFGKRVRELLERISDEEDDMADSDAITSSESEEEVMSIDDLTTTKPATTSTMKDTQAMEVAPEASAEGNSACSSPEPGQKRCLTKTSEPTLSKKIRTEVQNTAQPAKAIRKKEAHPAPTNVQDKKAPTVTQQTNVQVKKAPAMPPITCFSANVAEITRFAKINNITINVKNLNKGKTVIKTQTTEAFERMKTFLKERKINNFTFTPKQNKKNLVLLKGVHATHTEEDILEELVQEGIPAVKVSAFRSAKAKDKSFNSHVVELEQSSNLDEVSRKTFLMSTTVHWEPFKPTDIVQCKNCQRFGHIASNCGMQYVCVKCDQKHLPGQCSRNDGSGLEVFCANCKKTGHPASYRGCPLYKEKVAEKAKAAAAKKAQREFAAKSACKLTQPTVSFASIARTNTSAEKPMLKKTSVVPQEPTPKAVSSKTKTKTNNADEVNLGEEIQRVFGASAVTVFSKARSAIPSGYNSLSEAEKSVALATFLFQLCNV